MTEYHISWDIDIEADSPEAAAKEAWAIMRDPNAFPPFFTMRTDDGGWHEIDCYDQEDDQ